MPWFDFWFKQLVVVLLVHMALPVPGAFVEELVLCWFVGSSQFVDNEGSRQARRKPGQVRLLLVMSCVSCLVLWTCFLSVVFCMA